MRITDVETFLLRCNIDGPLGYSQGWFDTRSALIACVSTDEGISGVGEAFNPGIGSPVVVKTIVDRLFGPLIVGRDPFDTEVLWQEMYNSTRDFGQKGVIVSAISALDIALWDIKGKGVNLPVYKLLGGEFRRNVAAYAYGLLNKKTKNLVEEHRKEAAGLCQEGFKAIKMKIGYGHERDVELVAAVRDTIGDQVRLMVDANHAYSSRAAITLGHELEKLHVYWFEEPVIPEDIEGYIEVKNALNLAIAGGECEYTRFGFRDLLFRRAVDIVQPDTCAAGGLTECKKIAGMADACGIQYVPHVFGTGVAMAAALHLIASLPETPPSLYPSQPMLEYDTTPNPLREKLLRNPIVHRNGVVEAPDKGGLGIEIDMKALEKYVVQ